MAILKAERRGKVFHVVGTAHAKMDKCRACLGNYGEVTLAKAEGAGSRRGVQGEGGLGPADEWLQGVPLRSRLAAGGLICQGARLTSVKHTLLVRHLRRETGPC